MRVYLDDMRQPYEGWALVKTAQEAIDLLKTGMVSEISLDHDLGACDDCMNGLTPQEWLAKTNYQEMPNCEHFGTGYTVITWIEEQVIVNNFTAPIIHIHTANAGARVKMEACKKQIEKWNGSREMYWGPDVGQEKLD